LSNRGKRLALVAATTGYQTRMFADAARRIGLELRLATDRCHVLEDPWGDGAIALRFEHPEAAARVLAGEAFDAIAAVGDRPAWIAAMAAGIRGIPFHSPEAVAAAGNKYLARERFRSAGMPVPQYFRVPVTMEPEEAARRATYPAVLKPLGQSASRGVIRVNDHPSFVAAFHRIRSILDSPEVVRLKDEEDRFIQVETYIPGREFALEALMTDGRLQVLAIFDKPDPMEGPYFEESIYVTPSREPLQVQAALAEAVRQAVQALGLGHGPIHAEMRYNSGGVWMLEVAPRPIGGLCARALVFAPDTPLEELILMHAAGEDVSGSQLRDAASGVMMIPIPRAGVYAGVSGVEEAMQVEGIEDAVITAKQGQTLLPLPDGSSYLGFLFARGDSPGGVEQSLRQAHARLKFEILAKLPTVAG
jgi:biotin carboxylase